MLRITLWLVMGVLVWDFVSCDITCPDGSTCSDDDTCCESKHGYGCCPHPDAQCCADHTHCCPSGYRCNLVTEECEERNQPWMNIPMVKRKAAAKPVPPALSVSPLQKLSINHGPDQEKSSVVWCDGSTYCPDGNTCCRHPAGLWFCCGYAYGRCCLDGYHCCPQGFDCDPSYTHCVRGSMRYPFPQRKALSSVPAVSISPPEDKANFHEAPMMALTETIDSATAEAGVIRCDSAFYCSGGTTCCKGSTGKWNCCPYPLGQCCMDGQHCCQYGYTCDPSSMSCRKFYVEVPSGTQERAIAG